MVTVSVSPSGMSFVAFDFDGTLTDFRAADRAAIELVRQQTAPAVPPEVFLDVAVEEIVAFHARVDAGLENPLDLHRVRFGRLRHRFGMTSTPTSALVHRYLAELFARTVPVAGARAVLRRLRTDGTRIAIVSNAYDAGEQRGRISACFPEIDFDAIVIAAECAAPKPDRAPFDRLLALLDASAAEGLYVGDLPEYDVPGARAVGLRTVIVSGSVQARARAVAMGAQVCASLPGLIGVL